MGRRSDENPGLHAYRAKRAAEGTPEPFGGPVPAGSGRFVVQKHAASHLHYDLRLEIDGVLASWAVPKGPSPDPEVKRLAMHVEDHPLDYADFEGVIPDGNYGAGSVIVWDRGRWTSLEGDPAEGIERGKLLFDLHGYKLRGRWTLFRTGKRDGDPRQWLLMKKPDAEADPDREWIDTSVLSGLAVDEVADPGPRRRTLRRRLARGGAPQEEVDGAAQRPMLARAIDAPFDDDDWLFEIKYDGYRLLADRPEADARLWTRNGENITERFPEIAQAVGSLPFHGLLIDGELVVLDATGRPDFHALQRRAAVRGEREALRAAVRAPASLFAFDLLAAEGRDLRGLPLARRKSFLRQVLPAAGPLRYCDHVVGRGRDMRHAVAELRLEGWVAKRRASRYVTGRSDDWRKLRIDRTDDFVVVGWTPEKSGHGIGAALLAQRDGDDWRFAGSVGSGLGAAARKALQAAWHEVDRPPVEVEPLPRDAHWVEPGVVVEVRFKQWTPAGRLRHPAFVRVRDDKAAEDCVWDGPDPRPAEDPAGEGGSAGDPIDVTPPPPRVVVTNPDKVFWPEDGLTKRDLVDYYRAVAEHALPYLRDRPLTLTRYPDGIHGKSFFQKDAPPYVPAWVRTETMWSEHAQREIRAFVCDDADTLGYLANLATIPLHIWSSRFATLQTPDWCVLDLDPKEAPFEDVIRIARELHRLLDSIELPSFVKTSGSTGLHVLVPLGRQCTWEQSRQLALLLARTIVDRLPEIATVERRPSARQGKVYVDALQNGHGRLIAAPFCVRPREGAPVSTPLHWREVRSGLAITDHGIRSVPRRLARQRRDPFEGLLELSPDLTSALARLAELLGADADGQAPTDRSSGR